MAGDAAVLGKLEAAARTARATWQVSEAVDPAAALVAMAKEFDTIVVESVARTRRLFMPDSFARQVLRAGCREMLVLAPR